MVQIDVSYWAAGNGPYLETDHHFKDCARQTLGGGCYGGCQSLSARPSISLHSDDDPCGVDAS